MRIAYVVRANFDEVFGGDRVQTLKTKSHLEKSYGLSIDIIKSNHWSASLVDSYDIFHIFNMDYAFEFQTIVRSVRAGNKPLVCSSIYWSRDDLYRYGYSGLKKLILHYLPLSVSSRLRALAKLCLRPKGFRHNVRQLIYGEHYFKQFVLKDSDVILPNSNLEIDCLKKDFNLPNAQWEVVWNGVDMPISAESTVDSVHGISINNFEGAVVCACRIDIRKNLLALVRALQGTEILLFIIGDPAPQAAQYVRQLEVESTSNIHFVPKVTHAELVAIFHRASVHAMPSWYETPGLSNLEAGACGCQLVVTKKGSTYDYFGDQAYYCDPSSPEHIRKTIERALANGHNRQLTETIRSKFTWIHAAESTFNAYKRAEQLRGIARRAITGQNC